MRPFRRLTLLAAAALLTATAATAEMRYKVPEEEAYGSGFFAAPGLTGTVWTGPDLPEQVVTTYRFEPGGQLVYSRNGQTYRTATWKQTGNTVYIEMNQRYCETNAVIRDNQITGEYLNVRGIRWTFTLTRALAE